jgi:hypothetical protein
MDGQLLPASQRERVKPCALRPTILHFTYMAQYTERPRKEHNCTTPSCNYIFNYTTPKV